MDRAVFCPGSVTWGDVGTWATVVVALLSALAVFYLGRQANRVAVAQHEVAERERARKAFVIQRLIAADVLAAIPRVDALHYFLMEYATVDVYINDIGTRQAVADLAGSIELPILDTLVDRVHVLDEGPAQAAAHSIAGIRMLKFLSQSTITPILEHRGLEQQQAEKRGAVFRLMRTEVAIVAASLDVLHHWSPRS
jgi:hypothetical protein